MQGGLARLGCAVARATTVPQSLLDQIAAGQAANLAPVLDIYRTAADFEDQYQRSYSKDPTVCGRLGSAFITAQQRLGVAATAKHFPGLGSAGASQNTDLKPVTLNVSKSNLRAIDELPYTPAISAGVKLVMPSWAVYPVLDASLPAGLSPTIVQQEVRGRLGFQGVTVTDAINAGALASFGTNAQCAVSAAKAGMDLSLVCDTGRQPGQSVVAGLAGALQSGQLSQSAFDAARNRVTALRNGLS